MITGAHILLYSKDPEADRAFFRDILKFPAVDAGQGWLIFALPPAEAALHPAGGDPVTLGAALYLMCDDLQGTIQSLKEKDVICSGVTAERWGVRTAIQLPSGGELGLYQPTHRTAI
ncbi:MAG: extradiol dioxygenase [Acidobacteriota bacterium]|nr:extradiol dioxygenase [Acidobacteriota bacterium]